MELEELKPGSFYRRLSTGGVATLSQYVPGVFVTKEGSDANWHDAVEYCYNAELEVDDPNVKRYVLRADTFCEKFEPHVDSEG